jgi:hypothetical protein
MGREIESRPVMGVNFKTKFKKEQKLAENVSTILTFPSVR